VVNLAPRTFYPRERAPSTHRKGGWVCSRVGPFAARISPSSYRESNMHCMCQLRFQFHCCPLFPCSIFVRETYLFFPQPCSVCFSPHLLSVHGPSALFHVCLLITLFCDLATLGADVWGLNCFGQEGAVNFHENDVFLILSAVVNGCTRVYPEVSGLTVWNENCK
jgi:hypothetical protein